MIADVLAADPPPGFAARISCEMDIGPSDPVAIVHLRAGDGEDPNAWVLRNFADATAPRTACTFGSGDYWIHSLIDARHVVISSGPDRRFAIVDLPEVRYHWFRLPISHEFSQLAAVAPDLGAITWLRSSTEDETTRQAVMTDASGDHLLADLPGTLGDRCGSPRDSSSGAFSRSGNAYYVLDQLYGTVNVLVAGSGTDVELVLSPPDEGWTDAKMPLMALWAPTDDTLYYRVGSDVMRWRPGSEPELFLPDTPWLDPAFTPDGRYLAYATEDGVYLVDMAAEARPRLIRSGASRPTFLNATQLWFKAKSQRGCVWGEIPEHIYDLHAGADAPSIIVDVMAVWPATSSSSR